MATTEPASTYPKLFRSFVAISSSSFPNGEPMRLVGFTRHADSHERGTAETVTVMSIDYADLKTLYAVLSRPAP